MSLSQTTDTWWSTKLHRIPLDCSCHFIFMMASSNGNIFHVSGPLWGKFTGIEWKYTPPIISMLLIGSIQQTLSKNWILWAIFRSQCTEHTRAICCQQPCLYLWTGHWCTVDTLPALQFSTLFYFFKICDNTTTVCPHIRKYKLIS